MSGTCAHGVRVHRCGISSRTGEPYSGEFCPRDVCSPVLNDMGRQHPRETNYRAADHAEVRRNRDALDRLVADLAKENARLQREVNRLRAEKETWRVKAWESLDEVLNLRGGPRNAIYGDRVGKLLNLAIGADSDHEAGLAFKRARDQHLTAKGCR